MQTVIDDPTSPGAPPARRRLVRYGILAMVALFAAFWIWALFFASKEAVNKVGDRAWAARAEATCIDATEQRLALTDVTPLRDAGPEVFVQRAALVDQSTVILERMLDQVVSPPPDDPKGRGIVPKWEAEYRTYLQDRHNYADQLRASRTNLPFYETGDNGFPVSERLATFAADNEMNACAPPIDLSR